LCILRFTLGPKVQILDAQHERIYHRSNRTDQLPSITSSLRLASVATLPFSCHGDCLVKANVVQAIGLKNVAQEGDVVEQLRFAVSEG
jgi:hypothetical protein